jgi:NAD(P)-dependent dehydrogenase (short-subunit alcohol dehydrogenase family)
MRSAEPFPFGVFRLAPSLGDGRTMGLCLRNSVVLVTGASRGLGAATACAFARSGARVALLGRDAARLEEVAAQIRCSGGEALVVTADVHNWSTIDTGVGSVINRWGRIDVLVNAVGAKLDATVAQTDLSDALELLKTNYLGPMGCCRAVLPTMRHQHSGHIINVSSVLGKRATPGRGAYAASKAALNALTDALRVETVSWGITITLVSPGRLWEETELTPPRFAMSLEEAASRIVRCTQRPRRELVLTHAARGLVWLNDWAPGLVDRILRRVRNGGG